jgi:anthranilate/para-aminobenzoate synthase component I
MKGQPNTNHGLNQSNGTDRELPEVVLARRALPYMDPVLMFHRVCNGPNNLLLESAEIDSKRHLQSFLMTKSAVRIVCRGRVVTARALSVAGQQILDSLGKTFREREVAGLEVVQSDSAGSARRSSSSRPSNAAGSGRCSSRIPVGAKRNRSRRGGGCLPITSCMGSKSKVQSSNRR